MSTKTRILQVEDSILFRGFEFIGDSVFSWSSLFRAGCFAARLSFGSMLVERGVSITANEQRQPTIIPEDNLDSYHDLVITAESSSKCLM